MNGGGIPFEQLPANVDPLAMLGEMTKQQLMDLDQQATQAEQQATAESQNRLQTLQQEFNIEWTALQNEWKLLQGQPVSDVLLRHAENLREVGRNLNKKYELAATRISGKNRPDLLAIQQARQSAIAKINQQAAARQQEIAFWQKAEREFGVDHYVCLAGQLQAIGRQVSASELRPATPAQQIQEIDRNIKLLDANALNLGGRRPEEITPQERTKYRADMLTKRDQLVRQMGGQYAGPMQTATRLQRVAAGQMAGPFAQGIAEQKPAKKPLTREAAQRYKKAGLTKEQARQVAAQEGYTID